MTPTLPRVVFPRSLPLMTRHTPPRLFSTGTRAFTNKSADPAGSQNAVPGWKGRHGDDHVLYRDRNDAQGEPSNQARQDRAQGKEGSDAISEKDERNSKDKAKKEFPEAPGPIIGMNSERGQKGHS